MTPRFCPKILAEKWRRCCGSDDLCQELERDIREAIDKARQSERELANKTIQAMYKVAVRGHSPDDVLRVLKALLTEAEMDAESLKQSNNAGNWLKAEQALEKVRNAN